MAYTKHTIESASGQDFVIWGETNSINYFVSETVQPDAEDGVVNRQSSVKAFSRRQYPGDLTPISMAASTREWLEDPTKKVGRGVPGRSITLQAYDEDGKPTERRSFTLQGRMIDFRAWFDGTATYVTKVYSRAASYKVTPLNL